MNRGAGRAPGRGGDGRGRQPPMGGNGRGGGRNQGGNPFARQRNFVQGESSGSGNWEEYDGDRFQEANSDGGFGNGGFGNFNRGTGYGNNGRRGYANQYQRQGGFQNRNQTGGGGYRGGNNRNNNGGGAAATRRDGGIDQDFIQQTVQAVVAAVAAASQKSAIPTEAITAAEVVAPGLVPMQAVIPPVALHVVPPAVQPVMVPGATATAEDGATAAKKKKSDSCFRCKQPGHFIDDCTVPMCDICESVNHASNVCHLLQAPKPTVAMYGYANEALMFFELPLRGTYRPKVENAKLAKLTIEGDTMTIPEIIEQLKWIVPSENFQWEVTHFHNNVFKVKFPNKNEVQRMKHFKTYPMPNRATDMEFDEWPVMEEPTFMLLEVWLRVTAQPQTDKNLEGFEVDFASDQVPMIAGSTGASGSTSASAPDHLVAAVSADARDKQHDGRPAGVASHPGSDTRRTREAPGVGSPAPLADTLRSGSSTPRDGAVISVPELGEKLTGATFSSHAVGVKGDSKVLNGVQPAYCSQQTVEGLDAMDIAANMNAFEREVPNGAHVPTEEEVIAFGGIAHTGARSSARLQQQEDADDTVMEMAMKQAQQRHDILDSGTKQKSKLSFISKDSSEIIGLASRLGVSLGKNFQEVLETVDNIKKVEEIQNIQYLQKKIDHAIEGDNGPSNLVMSNVSSLCEDLVDDEKDISDVEDLAGDPLPPIKEKKVRQRRVYDSSNIRRSNRKRIKKIY
ncbi:hypothetical protein ACQ4PT_047527 [Festuca glaucescens]